MTSKANLIEHENLHNNHLLLYNPDTVEVKGFEGVIFEFKFVEMRLLRVCLLSLKTFIMNIEADIKWIQQELDKVKDPAFIEAIKNMLKYRSKVSTERISIEQYNKQLDVSIAQIAERKTYTHKEMENRIKQLTKQ